MTNSDEEAQQLLAVALQSMDEYYSQRGIFQDRFGFGRTPAIVVVDFALGWTDEAYAGGSSRLDGPVENTSKLLTAGRCQCSDHLHDVAIPPTKRRPALQVGCGLVAELSSVGRAGMSNR